MSTGTATTSFRHEEWRYKQCLAGELRSFSADICTKWRPRLSLSALVVQTARRESRWCTPGPDTVTQYDALCVSVTFNVTTYLTRQTVVLDLAHSVLLDVTSRQPDWRPLVPPRSTLTVAPPNLIHRQCDTIFPIVEKKVWNYNVSWTWNHVSSGLNSQRKIFKVNESNLLMSKKPIHQTFRRSVYQSWKSTSITTEINFCRQRKLKSFSM